MSNKNNIRKMTIESYKKKYHNRTHRLLKYTKKDVEAFDKLNKTKDYLLRGHKWTLIGDTYYEIPKAPRLTWFRNLSAGVQASVCLLGAGVVATSVALPLTLINANKTTPTIKPFSKEDIKIDPEFAEQVTVSEAKTDKEGNDVVVLSANDPDQFVSAVTATDQHNVVLTDDEVDWEPTTATLTVFHSTILNHGGNGIFALALTGNVEDRPEATDILITNEEGVTSVPLGGKLHFKATVAPRMARQDVTWSIFGETTNVIDPDTGEFTANEGGEFVIIATSKSSSGINALMPITVIEEGQITIDLPVRQNLLVGEVTDITAVVTGTQKTVTWELEENEFIEKVSTSGNTITLKANENTPHDMFINLIARIEGESAIAVCSLKVNIIALDQYELNMKVGEAKEISFTMANGYDVNKLQVSYPSAEGEIDPQLDIANKKIIVYGNSSTYETVEFEIQYEYNTVEKVSVDVVEQKRISFNEEKHNIPFGKTHELNLYTYAFEGSEDVQFRSEDTTIVETTKIDNNYVKITAKKEGTTKIIASCDGIEDAECTINVLPSYTAYLQFDLIQDTTDEVMVSRNGWDEFPDNLSIPATVKGNCVNDESAVVDQDYKITRIRDYGFNAIGNLKNIDLSSTSYLKEIGRGAFNGCIKLENVYFNSSLEAIEESAFDGSFNSESANEITLTLPSSINLIEQNAFRDANINKIYFNDQNYWYIKDGNKIDSSELGEDKAAANAIKFTSSEGTPSEWQSKGIEKISNRTKFVKSLDSFSSTFKQSTSEYLIGGDLTTDNITFDGSTVTNPKLIYDVNDGDRTARLTFDELPQIGGEPMYINLNANNYIDYFNGLGNVDDDCFIIPVGIDTITYNNTNDINFPLIKINSLGYVEEIQIYIAEEWKTLKIDYSSKEPSYNEVKLYTSGTDYQYVHSNPAIELTSGKTINYIVKSDKTKGYGGIGLRDNDDKQYSLCTSSSSDKELIVLDVKNSSGQSVEWNINSDNHIVFSNTTDEYVISIKINEIESEQHENGGLTFVAFNN